MRPLLLATLLGGLASCSGTPEAGPPPPAPALTPWQLPADWAEVSAPTFEELVLRELPSGETRALDSASLLELSGALDRMDASSVRAAAVLGRSRTPASGEVIWNRLEKRELGPARSSDAGDVVIAAALARFPDAQHYWRLVRLVDGAQPHPDFEVRVECACTALMLGLDRVIPFLLQVLRAGTWEGLADEWDSPPPPTTAWARGRAAEALSRRAGVPITYRTDAPLADREREARRLAQALAPLLEVDAESAGR